MKFPVLINICGPYTCLDLQLTVPAIITCWYLTVAPEDLRELNDRNLEVLLYHDQLQTSSYQVSND